MIFSTATLNKLEVVLSAVGDITTRKPDIVDDKGALNKVIWLHDGKTITFSFKYHGSRVEPVSLNLVGRDDSNINRSLTVDVEAIEYELLNQLAKMALWAVNEKNMRDSHLDWFASSMASVHG